MHDHTNKHFFCQIVICVDAKSSSSSQIILPALKAYLDMSLPASAALMDRLRFDTVWHVELEGYRRSLSAEAEDAEPPVHATFELGITWEKITPWLAKQDWDALRMIGMILQQCKSFTFCNSG